MTRHDRHLIEIRERTRDLRHKTRIACESIIKEAEFLDNAVQKMQEIEKGAKRKAAINTEHSTGVDAEQKPTNPEKNTEKNGRSQRGRPRKSMLRTQEPGKRAKSPKARPIKKTRRVRTGGRRNKRWTDAEAEWVLEMWNSGKSVESIARLAKRSERSIYSFIHLCAHRTNSA